MATNATSKVDAASKNAPVAATVKAVKAPAPATVKAVKAPAEKVAAKKPAAKHALIKAAPKKVAAKKLAPKTAAPKTAAPKKVTPKKTTAAAKTANPVSKLKDSIMATSKTTDFTKAAKDIAADVQSRAKTAFAKSGELAAEAGDFNKGNIEAVVETGKIFFAGVKEFGSDQIAAGKTVVETVTADVNKMTSVKSPNELLQLQGELARRNFDAAVSFSSKSTEAWTKLYNDAFAPISSRVSVATEKFSNAA